MIKSKYFKFVGTAIILSITLVACSNQSQKGPSNVEKKINSYIYTANESGSVSKIDLATNKVVTTIKDEGSPHNVQVSPDGNVIAYTSPVMMEKGQTEHGSMSMNGNVVFYDTSSDKLIKKVEVGKHPAHVVYTSDGKYVLVTNNEDNNFSIIDAKNYNLIKNVPVGNGPHGFRISNDNKFAYVANMGEDTVSVVDIENYKELRKIKVGNTPVTTGITKDGNTLVITVNSEDVLAIIDLKTDQITKVPVGKGPAQVFVGYDGKYAFVANQGTEKNPSNSVSKIDLATKQVVATIETGKGAHGVVVSPDNKYVYVTNMYDDSVSIIDNATNKVTANISVDAEPNGISFKK
ncbi:hypothetical protein CFOLD11_44170 [Clostridium folliculivorans]|uniref:6-phosphogluconolactonase n=1 Tax=Clostridium folliculivorans TaxID=2886038 RepID=A0A9W5Y6Q9_9CLOT|nr:YncE family protein [Clostridium folliculivorans]GKU27590.1 hypothetical protein CFOLD11_44170 [Clostridium folliculivorans]